MTDFQNSNSFLRRQLRLPPLLYLENKRIVRGFGKDCALLYIALPLRIIDAVFSIGAKYKSTQNAVWYFAEKNMIHLDRRTGESHFDIDSLLNTFAKLDDKDEREVADTLFNNK